MTKPTVTATDRLANVLDVVELGQRTGLLRVERGNGTMREEGEVYFAQGKPIYAAIAGLRGREALHILAQWTGCYFAFDPQAAQIANVAAANRGASLFRSNTVSIRWRRRHCTYPVGFACDKPGAFEEDTIGKTFSTH